MHKIFRKHKKSIFIFGVPSAIIFALGLLFTIYWLVFSTFEMSMKFLIEGAIAFLVGIVALCFMMWVGLGGWMKKFAERVMR